MLVSIVIATKNEELNLGICLESIMTQTLAANQWEIIVVDNFSTDATLDIAKQYTTQVYSKGPERSSQRNFGIKQAQGTYILFLDADMILAPTLLEDCLCQFQDHAQGLVGLWIPEIILGTSLFAKIRRFERQFYDATVIDGVRFFKKADFDAIAGFDENLFAAEDWDLDKRLKARGTIKLLSGENKAKISHWPLADFINQQGVNPAVCGSVIFHNESTLTFNQYLKKKAYYSTNLDQYKAKWGANDPDVKKQLGVYYRFIAVFLEHAKWKKLLAHPILTLGMYGSRIAVGLYFLINK